MLTIHVSPLWMRPILFIMEFGALVGRHSGIAKGYQSVELRSMLNTAITGK